MHQTLIFVSKLCLISFIYFFLVSNTFCQETITIDGQVVDIITKKPIEGVNILIKEENTGTISNVDGFFSMQSRQKSVDLTISHVAYQTSNIRFNSKTDQKPLVILLTPKSYELTETIITAKRQYKYSLLDFNFIDSAILILAKKHRNNSYALFLLDESFDTIARMNDLPERKPEKLFKDCMGNCHLLFKDIAYQVFYSGKKLELKFPVSIDHFYGLMENCLFETNECLVFKRRSLNAFLHEYYSVRKDNHEVNDMIKTFEYEKANALTDEMQFIKRNPGAFPSAAGKTLAILYAQKIAFKPSYNFLEKIGDTVYYFDHGNNQLVVYSDRLDLLRQINISYHQYKNWNSQLKIDKPASKAYGVYTNGSKYEIHEINLQDGTTEVKQLIPLIYPEKLKINNGYIYFLYKEIGNVWSKKELYRLKI